MKYKWNKISIAEAVSGSVVLIITAIIAWNTWNYYLFESNFKSALNAYGSKRLGNVMGPLENAISSYGSWPYALLLKARMLAGENKLDEAEALYQDVANSQGGELKAAALIGKSVTLMRKYDRTGDDSLLSSAESALKEAQSLNLLQPDVAAELGQVYIRQYLESRQQKDLKAARSSFKKAFDLVQQGQTIYISPLYDLYGGQGILLTEEEKFRRARRMYDRLYQLDPERVETLANRGYAMARYYDSDAVASVMLENQKMLEWNEFSTNLMLAGKRRQDTELGEQLRNAAFQLQMAIALACYKENGTDRICKNMFDNAVLKTGDTERPALYASRGVLLLEKAQALLKKGNNRNARRFLNTAQSDFEQMQKMQLSKNKTRRFVLTNLGTVYYHLGKNYDSKFLEKARNLFEKARELNPEQASIYRTLAIAYYAKKGDVKTNWEKSRKYGKKYLEMNNEDSDFQNWFNENF